jgi:hypothetical protein
MQPTGGSLFCAAPRQFFGAASMVRAHRPSLCVRALAPSAPDPGISGSFLDQVHPQAACGSTARNARLSRLQQRSRARVAREVFFPVTFHSILFERTEDGIKYDALDAPVFFADLNLDQIIDAITAGRDEYNLKPFFYISLNDINTIKYRHEIMQDLENATLFEHAKSFAQKMRTMREHLAQADKLYYESQKDAWFLDASQMIYPL